MGQNSKDKILKVYFENTEKTFTVRELSNLTKVPRATVQNKLNELRKEKLINNNNEFVGSLLFKIKKINYYVEKLVRTGLIDYLVDELNPSCIILFGSFRKGDSVKESDIDLFVESPIKKDLNFKMFEKKIGHKIDLFVESNISNLQNNLFNNVVNGIKLYGSFKIK